MKLIYNVVLHLCLFVWLLWLSQVAYGISVSQPGIKLPTSTGSWKKQEFQKNIYFCFIEYAKAFDCVDHNKLWKMLKEMGPTWSASWEIFMQVRKQQLELDMEQTGSK